MSQSSPRRASPALLVVGLLSIGVGCSLDRPPSDIALARYSRMQIECYMVALDDYKADVGDYPNSREGLQALRVAPIGKVSWKGPYLQRDVGNDGWGRPFVYVFPGKHGDKPDIISYGKDGAPGGTGANEDLTSWSLQTKR